MTLQFDPSPYLEAFQYGQKRDQQARDSAAQGIQGIGQGIEQLAQIPGQQRDARMNQLAQFAKLSPDKQIDPNAAMNWVNTGNYPAPSSEVDSGSATTPDASGTLSTAQPYSNGGAPSSSLFPGGMGNVGSPIVAAHKQFLSKNGNSPAGMTSLFKSPNVDYGKVVSGMDQGDYSGYQTLNEKQRGDVEKIREYNSNKSDRQLKDKELQDYRKQTLTAQSGKIDATMGMKETQFDQRDLTRLTNQLNSDHDLINARQKINNVDTAMKNLDQVRTQPGGADRRQMVEIAATTMRVLKNSGQITEGELNDLIPETYKGNFNKFLEKLTNQPQGLEAQAFVDRFEHTLQREKLQAQNQLELGFNRTTSLHGDVLDRYPDKAKQLYSSWGVNHPTYNPGSSQNSITNQGGGQKIGRFIVTAGQ